MSDLARKNKRCDFGRRMAFAIVVCVVALGIRVGDEGRFFVAAQETTPASDASAVDSTPTSAANVDSGTASGTASASGGTWRAGETAGSVAPETLVGSVDSASLDETNSGSFNGTKTTKYSLDAGNLPNESGQFWVVYDLAPYTERYPNVENPQLSIVDWITFDAGEDFWRKEPFAVFSASSTKMRVYHNANVQRYVANVLDRFIDPTKRNKSFSIKIVAVQSPEWRVRVASYLTPAPVKIVGSGADVQGWVVERANFAKVVEEIEKRSDYTLLNSVKNIVPNGEKNGWAAQSPKRQYVRDVRVDPSAVSGYVEDVATVDEGFRIEATPLLSTNGEALEVLFRYRSTVVEKTKSFSLAVPTTTAPRQRLDVEKPSIVSCDFKGKISFLNSKAAVVDLGMTPMTLPKKNESNRFIGNITKFVAPQSAFYDVLILIEETN